MIFNDIAPVYQFVSSPYPVLNEQECDSLKKTFDLLPERIQKGRLGLDPNDTAAGRNELDVRDVDIIGKDSIQELYPNITHKISAAIHECNQMTFGFELSHFDDIQLARYKVGQHYKEHVDIPPEANYHCRKLTFVIKLNDNYTGGGLTMPIVFPKNEDLDVMKDVPVGHFVVFPTYVSHSIQKITSGTRYSLFGWVSGPRFK